MVLTKNTGFSKYRVFPENIRNFATPSSPLTSQKVVQPIKVECEVVLHWIIWNLWQGFQSKGFVAEDCEKQFLKHPVIFCPFCFCFFLYEYFLVCLVHFHYWKLSNKMLIERFEGKVRNEMGEGDGCGMNRKLQPELKGSSRCMIMCMMMMMMMMIMMMMMMICKLVRE